MTNGRELLLAFAVLDEGQLTVANDTDAIRRSFREQKARRKKKTASVICCMAAILTVIGVSVSLRFHKSTVALTENTDPVDVSGFVSSPLSTTPASSRQAEQNTQQTQNVLALESDPAQSAADASSTSPTQTAEVAIEPRWEEKTLPEKYTSLEFQYTTYTVGRSAINAQYLGEKTGTGTLIGFDVYTDAFYRISANVYTLTDISTACALGIRFDDGSCYAYINTGYAPATLFQFLTDLNLRKDLSFGMAYAEYFDEDMTYHTRTFSDFDDALIWDRLLNADTAMQVTDFPPLEKKLVSVSAAVSSLGYTIQSFSVTEDGWIITNLLETAKVFYVGPERAQAFMDDLLNTVPYTDTVPSIPVGATEIPE